MFSKKTVHFRDKSPVNRLKTATLQDLCEEDKAKIGELIKKLAEEKGQKQQLLRQLQEKQRLFETNLKEIREENQQVALESVQLKEKFKESLNLLRNLQKTQEKRENREVFLEKPAKNMSPKREILRIAAGESARKLQNLHEKPAISQENLEKPEKPASSNTQELALLKEEIDSLAENLKLISQKTFTESQETAEKTRKKALFFENLQKPEKPAQFSEKINVIEETLEDLEVSQKWLARKEKLLRSSRKTAGFNEFSCENLTNLREFVDKKLEKFVEIETPSPRKLSQKASLLREPSFIENNSEKSFENLKETLRNELRSEIQDNLRKFAENELFQEKMQEFLAIKQRVFAENREDLRESAKKSAEWTETEDFDKENDAKNTENECFLRKNERFLKEKARKSKKTAFSQENSSKNLLRKPEQNAKNSKKTAKTATFPDSSSQNLKKTLRNCTETSQFSQETSHFPTENKNPAKSLQEADELNELLRNCNEDFFEDQLFDLIEELDQRELLRNATPFAEKRLTFNDSCESDASVRDILRKVREMEESQRNLKK